MRKIRDIWAQLVGTEVLVLFDDAYSLVSAESSLREWVRGMETMVIQPRLCPLHCKLR